MKSSEKLLAFLSIASITAIIFSINLSFAVFYTKNNKPGVQNEKSNSYNQFLSALSNGFEGTYDDWIHTINSSDSQKTNNPEIFIDENGHVYVDGVDMGSLTQKEEDESPVLPSYVPTDSVVFENQRVYNELVNNSFGNNNGINYTKTNLLFFTDCHIDYYKPTINYYNMLSTFYFANNSPISFGAIINGGDTITPVENSPKEKEKEKFAAFFNEAKKSKYPVIYSKGNHDLNDWANNPENAFNDDDWSEMFLDYAERQYRIVRQDKSNGKKSTWHYYDIEEERIRIVCVDVQDTDKTIIDKEGNIVYHGGVSWYISQEQMDWIIKEALNFDNKQNKDWGVVVVGHQSDGYSDYTDNEIRHGDAIQKMKSVLVAFNNQSTYSNDYCFESNSFFDLKIDADFTKYALEDKKPKIICWLLGHEHCDKYECYQGINMIWTSCSECYAGGMPDVPRVENSSSQNCFDILTIDATKKNLSIIRYGAGKDRFLDEPLHY